MLGPAVAIIKRELLTTLRRPRYYYLVAVGLLMLLVLFCLFYANVPRIDVGNALYMRQLNHIVLFGFSYLLYGVAMLLIPTIASNAICAEKQEDQLDLIRMSYIRPSAFLFGKLVNILGLYVLTVLALLPFAGALFFFTGIDWMQYVQILFLIFMAAISSTMIGLLCSAYCFRTIPAAIMTYLLVLFAQGGLGVTLVMTMALIGWNVPLSGPLLGDDWLASLVIALFPARGILDIGVGSLDGTFFVAVALYNLAIILGCAVLACRLLNLPTVPMKVNQKKTIEDSDLLQQRRKRFPYYLVDPCRRRPLIPDRLNPILAKERYTSLARRSTASIRILYCLAIFAFVVGTFATALAGTERDASRNIIYLFTVHTVLLLSILPTFLATSFSKEHEWGNWDMLRMTGVTPLEVTWGKLRGALYTLFLPLTAIYIGFVPFIESAWRFPHVFEVLFIGATLMLTSVVLLLTITLFIATSCQKSLPALVITYVAGILLLVAIPAGLQFWFELFGRRGDIIENSYLLSPLSTLIGTTISTRSYPVMYTTLQSLYVLLFSLVLFGGATYQCSRRWNEGQRRPRHESPPAHSLESSS